MKPAAIPDDERARLDALLRYQILDSTPESDFDDITQMASYICGTPISVMSIIDSDRQWFKSKVGLDLTETPRDLAFCAHTILQKEVLIVNDTLNDNRFFDNPLVTASPSIRFYAGVPLMTPDGYALGSLCAIDRVPREMTAEQIRSLDILARQVVKNLELRVSHRRLRQMTEQLTRLNAGKDRLFNMVSHDLKSPFSGVLGLLQMLADGVENMSKAEIYRDVQMLHTSAGKTFNLLERLLQWSTFETGELPYRPEVQDVDEVLSGMVTLLRGMAERKSIALEMLPSNGHAVLADHAMMHSVIQNLVGNALKFTPENGRITLSARREGDWIEISVRDSGVGMTAAVLEEILQGSAGNSTFGTAGETGTGLGLSLSRGFVEKHGGRFTAESAVGKGSTFRFTLPRAG